MKKDFLIILLLSIFILIAWRSALFNFFAQDDFILINQFSQNSLFLDLKNVFGLPTVTHWRPLHNFYFFLAGNFFGKNYVGYHALTLIFHIGASFLIYKTVFHLLKNRSASVAGGIFYGIHPAHFVSVFWTAGGATVIGFFFLIASIYSYLTKKNGQSIVLSLLSILASEAMIVGLSIFAGYELLIRRKHIDKRFLAIITIIAAVFLAIRLAVFTPKTTFDIYQVEISTKVFATAKYYLLRIAGFAESSGDKLVTILLLALLLSMAVLLFKSSFKDKKKINYMVFSFLIIISGLFPFILIPSHLSPHYMNVSIFGFSLLLSIVLKQSKILLFPIAILVYTGVALGNINLTKNNSWLIERSNTAHGYINFITSKNPAFGQTLFFSDNQISSSREAYISLGGGKAIDWWFKDKQYKYCFTFVETCQVNY